MRIVVTGSRKFVNAKQIWAEMDKLLEEHPDLEVAHGKSKGGGVDLIIEEWAWDRDVPQWPFPVRSGKSGIDGNHRGAPLNRNERMVKSFMPDRVVAFRSAGKSNGTDHCLGIADKLGIPTTTFPEET